MLIDTQSLKFSNPNGFVVIEGVNGAGKTTLQKKIVQYLESQGQKAIATREPGSTPIGVELRRLVLEPRQDPLSPHTELFIFAADRAEHVAKIIKPSIENHTLVISDRYYYSTTAFQGYGRGVDLELIGNINKSAINGVVPDFVLLADLDPLEGLRRTRTRADGEKDSFEAEELAFHTRLRDGFLRLAKVLPEQFLVLNASQSPDGIFAQVKPVLDIWITALKTARA